ncbi:ABC transporter permease [Corynebacterium sp. CCM 9203]|uniref:ABC transporter permease n=1 Tax=Corynebacterium sp. CCM 9203 TaxID=3057615 RepID=UPI003523500E
MYKKYRNNGNDETENLGGSVGPTADMTISSQPFAQSATIAEAQADGEEHHPRLKGLDPDVPAGTTPGSTKPMSKTRLYVRRFARNKMAVIGLIIFVGLVFLAVIGPFTTNWAYDDPDFLALSTPPSSEHWFGTNSSGNDLYAMTVHGLGRSLTIALLVSIGTTIISAFVGTAAALFGGNAEKAILGLIHFLLVIPSFLVIALLVSGSGGDWKLLTIVLIAFGWTYFARVIWSMALSLREREYVRAARYMGVSSGRIIIRHMIPNIGSLLIINLTLGVVSTVMSETGLSFLGLGVKIPDVSLGTLLSTGANALESSPWEFYFPAAVLSMLTVSMAFIADGLRDALDPNSAAGGTA